ncbi:hypothetical protein AS156_35135 [Bradyrhizobium macuxiense]|uniref:Uncharacterized protein n=2 Tax=Bradyrhizobium macuxiense TaxID=1755647 RepID=A0A109JZT8_9BRAD|nr:hypothetical protein AS156_35135 [Bradyrhizobium macuxiense]
MKFADGRALRIWPAVKLRLQKPGVDVLQAAMWVLLGFFLLAGTSMIIVKSSIAGAPKAAPPTAPAAIPPAPSPASGKKG